MQMHRRIRLVALVVAAVLVVVLAGFVLWALDAAPPGSDAQRALRDSSSVTVRQDDGYTFTPRAGAKVGFILYPGARVDPASYSVEAHRIAASGYLVVVPSLRLNLAVLDQNAADRVIARHPEINRWVVGGHSLGGAMASTYANQNRDRISGLALWAAYPSESTSLADYRGAVASISGSRDGLSTPAKIDASRERLPPNATFVRIAGGNHAQFGDYGPQSGDNTATVSKTDQWRQVERATITLLAKVAQP